MFVYDAPDMTIAPARLDNPLFYDASIAVVDGNTCLSWLEFVPGKGDVVWVGTRDSGGKWLDKLQVTKDPGDYANPTVTIDGKKNRWITYEAVQDGKWKIVVLQSKNDAAGVITVAEKSGSGANINHSVVALVSGGLWVSWQADNNGQFDVYAQKFDGNGPSQPQLVSDSPFGDWHPSIAAAPNGNVYVAWDSYDGKNYNIRAREFAKGQWGKTFAITSSTNFNANAQVVADHRGRVWISWEEDGPNWGRAYRPRTDARKDSQKMSDEIGSLHRFRRLHLAELIADRHELRTREIPQPSFDAAALRKNAPAGIKHLGVFYQSSQLAVDGGDRLWLVYRHFYMPEMGITSKTHVQNDWGIYARCLNNDIWSGLYRFDEGQGDALQRISVASTPEGIAAAWTYGRTDRRDPQNWFEDELAPNKVVRNVVKKGAGKPEADEEDEAKPKGKKKKAKPGPAAAHPATVAKQDRGVALATIQYGANDRQTFRATTIPAKLATVSLYQGERKEVKLTKPKRPEAELNSKHYELFYGDFHRHTDISLCFWPGDGTMDDAYRYGIDAAPLDFLGITDHTHDIAMGDPLSLMWHRIRKEVNRHALTNSFVPFYSYERSRGDTDHNVISLRDDMLRPHTYPHSEFWKELDTNTFTIPHQPFNSVLWKTNDRMHRPLMEIYQGFRNHTCESDAKEGLASGNEVGFIASSDHLSTGASYACVWAEKPTRESIFRALQARRTFAATDHIRLRVTCGDHWMGEKFTVKETPSLNIDVEYTAPIAKIELFTDGEPREVGFRPFNKNDNASTHGSEHLVLSNLDTPQGTPNSATGKTSASDKLTGQHTFFVRITQVDGNKAWSSPMWINIQP